MAFAAYWLAIILIWWAWIKTNRCSTQCQEEVKENNHHVYLIWVYFLEPELVAFYRMLNRVRGDMTEESSQLLLSLFIYFFLFSFCYFSSSLYLENNLIELLIIYYLLP